MVLDWYPTTSVIFPPSPDAPETEQAVAASSRAAAMSALRIARSFIAAGFAHRAFLHRSR
jgi:hypothetical protein